MFRKKTGAKIIQVVGTLYPAAGCVVIPFKWSEGGADFGYMIHGHDTRYAFFIPKNKAPLFLGHDLNLVDIADLDGDGKSEVIVTVSNSYKIIRSDGTTEAVLPLQQEP